MSNKDRAILAGELERMYAAAVRVGEYWEKGIADVDLSDHYPFHEDFDELLRKMGDWVGTALEKLGDRIVPSGCECPICGCDDMDIICPTDGMDEETADKLGIDLTKEFYCNYCDTAYNSK